MTTRNQIQTISIPYESTIRQAMQAINRGVLGLALLVDPETERFLGLVTDGDIRRALLKGFGLDSPVRSIPRPQPKIARVGTPIDQIAQLFSPMVRTVPLLDDWDRVVDLAVFDRRVYLPVSEPSLGERELSYVSECVLTGWISSAGKFVTRFEEMFAEFCGTKYAAAVSNGTTALHLALVSLGVGPGDEVIVPSFTFIATANAVTYTGARPVFVDSEKQTWNIDPDLIEAAVTPRTKAIIPVHLYGHPANMEPIMAIAKRHNLAVIEDAAEAHGATYKGQRVGSIGDIGVFSFYGNKIITTGEGGMLITDDAALAEKARILRDHGMSPQHRYWHPVLGFNYRLTNLQAAIGVAQVERIEQILAAKRRLAQVYLEGLSSLPGIRVPPEEEWAMNVYWLFSIVIEQEVFGMDRDTLMAKLKEAGIDTRPLFPPVHKQPIYNTCQDLPVAQYLSQNGLSLPSAVTMNPRDVEWVNQTVRSIWESIH